MLRPLDDLAGGLCAALRLEGGSRSARTELRHRFADAARDRAVAVGLSAP